MISISKDEAKMMNREFGVNFGENGISRTHNKSHHYFLCESKRNMDLIKKIREGRITN